MRAPRDHPDASRMLRRACAPRAPGVRVRVRVGVGVGVGVGVRVRVRVWLRVRVRLWVWVLGLEAGGGLRGWRHSAPMQKLPWRTWRRSRPFLG